jgi:hypothetical protein
MTERQHRGKEDEKELQKQEEKGSDEKSWEEKWRRDPLNAGTWAVIIIWAGLVLLADNLGLLARFEIREEWGLIFLGAGVILLLEILIRLALPDYRRPLMGNIIFAVAALGGGLSILDLFDWQVIWAVVLIAIGLGVLVQGLFRRR